MADAGADGEEKNKRTPSEFLKQVLGRPVVVKLNSGVDYRGMLRRLHSPTHNLRVRTRHGLSVFDLCQSCYWCGVLIRRALAGILAHLDGYMNIAMEQTEEYQNGVLKAKYGDAFIRGNNGALMFGNRMCPLQTSAAGA